MNEKELQDLWEKLKNGVDGLGSYTYEKFKERMSTADGRSNFHKLYGDHLSLGDFKIWEKKLTTPEKIITNKPIEKKDTPPKKQDAFVAKKCDENTYPWTKGCMNNKIGQMNLRYFGDRYGNIYGDELYNRLDNLGYFGLPDQKDGEISEFIYNKVLELGVKESKFINRKKVIKETVKNILGQRLNKK